MQQKKQIEGVVHGKKKRRECVKGFSCLYCFVVVEWLVDGVRNW